MEKYSLPPKLKKALQKEVKGKNHDGKKVIFGEVAYQLFPNIKRSALIIGDKLELTSYV